MNRRRAEPSRAEPSRARLTRAEPSQSMAVAAVDRVVALRSALSAPAAGRAGPQSASGHGPVKVSRSRRRAWHLPPTPPPSPPFPPFSLSLSLSLARVCSFFFVEPCQPCLDWPGVCVVDAEMNRRRFGFVF